jgi:hypothetical protein
MVIIRQRKETKNKKKDQQEERARERKVCLLPSAVGELLTPTRLLRQSIILPLLAALSLLVHLGALRRSLSLIGGKLLATGGRTIYYIRFNSLEPLLLHISVLSLFLSMFHFVVPFMPVMLPSLVSHAQFRKDQPLPVIYPARRRICARPPLPSPIDYIFDKLSADWLTQPFLPVLAFTNPAVFA